MNGTRKLDVLFTRLYALLRLPVACLRRNIRTNGRRKLKKRRGLLHEYRVRATDWTRTRRRRSGSTARLLLDGSEQSSWNRFHIQWLFHSWCNKTPRVPSFDIVLFRSSTIVNSVVACRWIRGRARTWRSKVLLGSSSRRWVSLRLLGVVISCSSYLHVSSCQSGIYRMRRFPCTAKPKIASSVSHSDGEWSRDSFELGPVPVIPWNGSWSRDYVSWIRCMQLIGCLYCCCW